MSARKFTHRFGSLLVPAVLTMQSGLGAAAAVLRTEQTSLQTRDSEGGPRVTMVGSGSNTWLNLKPEKLIDSIDIEGRSTPVHWRFNKQASRIDPQEVALIYECSSPKLRVTWNWHANATKGPIEHTIHIQNLTNKTVWIPLQDSFQFDFAVNGEAALTNFFIDKGGNKPTSIGTHHELLGIGLQWTGFSSTYARALPGEAAEIIPFFAIENAATNSGWYAGLEFSGRTRLTLTRAARSVSGAIGLNPSPGPFRSRLKPGETFETPTVFVGAFSGGVDGLGNVLRPWVRRVLGNANTWLDPRYPLLVNNSWGSGMQVDQQVAERMIRDAAQLGLEMFHLDAGWFRGVGDWYPDPKKFAHGLTPVADYAHRHGLKFGLWVDWTQAGVDSQRGALNFEESTVRDWTVSDLPRDWKPAEFKGQTIDIGEPAAHAYAEKEVSRIVDAYRLDMLEHDGYLVAQGCVRDDHPHAAPDPSRLNLAKDEQSYFVESSNSTDVSYGSVRAYYAIHASLRKWHPNLLLEVCNDGGRMVDFGSAAHGDYFSITDSYDPVSNRQAFYDASHLLPPAMLECYVKQWPAPRIENFRYMLRSGMMGWLTIMQDTSAWAAPERATAKSEFDLYKRELRPLIRDADLYHVGPRPDGIHWDGVEYFDRARKRGVLFAFHGSDPSEMEHTFRLGGILRDRHYRLRFHDETARTRLALGNELLASGLRVTLPLPNTSELIFIDEVPAATAESSRETK